MSTTQTKTPEIEIDKVDVPKDFNSRRHFDKGELEALAASIERVGVINPDHIQGLYGCQGMTQMQIANDSAN